MAILTLNLKGEYFDQIKAGVKTEEYRLLKPCWVKRLARRNYDEIHLLRGYPPKDDDGKRITRPWRGCVLKSITHPHFGSEPVTVFAINVAIDD